ncbi:type VI secretion system-associated FHA domain protein TagH [Bisbaumannia pacifica]|uniref:Type VI secretion system-associated FHA domain protein TagH n=1 Tax=Bisbaumannia pacifica TaxID=77098 RepID=A0ABD4L443_9GAMM|nr:type VI secretion system-associated FHA domain protein TagH [Halomonas pacifica]MBH8580711.1 type VI secretion system-associated FHA domain protein TagH [Halomonas pacifica]
MHASPHHDAITLVVTNSERLEGRSTSSHVFAAAGGTIGSGGDDWLLQDQVGRIRPNHAEIRRIDGRFCLIDRCGHTFVNQATLPLGRGRRAALRDGDALRLGDYCLRVHLGAPKHGNPGSQPLTQLINEEPEALEEGGLPVTLAAPGAPARSARQAEDPLAALGGVSPGAGQQDPMLALTEPEALTIDDDLLATPGSRGYSPPPRHATAVDMPTIRTNEDLIMDERLLNDLERSVGEQLEERWHKPQAAATGHVGADPLLRGLGAELPLRDSEEQQAFLAEAGQTLRAALEGLMALQRAQDDSRYPLRDRRLQPIEDNPLRLGQSYPETLTTLFAADRSPVHLSPPAAVAESLAHQGQHQQAVEEAIERALGAILDAFAPEALLRRFHAYRGAGHRLEDEGGWAWEMYRHYYRELNSGRQQGFQKLFWEVFEQAYDHSVRRQQREDA